MSFILSKVLAPFVAPDLVLLGILVLGLVLSWTRCAKFGRGLTAIATLAFLVIAVAPTDDWFLKALEDRFPAPRELPAHIDGIIALGGAIDAERTLAHGLPSLTTDGERITAFVTLARRYPDAKLVFTSGSASIFPGRPREADTAKQAFADLGLDTSRIIFERDSRNTVENAVYSKRLADPKPGETWILITSAWHMPRSVGIFRVAGWPVVPYPVAYRSGGAYEIEFASHLGFVDQGVHEWIGLIAYHLLGRTDAFFPAP